MNHLETWWTMRRVRLARLVPVVIAFACVGCEAFLPPTVDTSHVPPNVMNLAVYATLDTEHPNWPLEDFITAIQQAGIQIVRLDTLPADVKVELTDKRTFVRDTVEFRRHMHAGEIWHVRRVLDISYQGQPIDHIVYEWEANKHDDPPVTAVTLANAFLSSPKLAAWTSTPHQQVRAMDMQP